jgi:hypothetical protein
MLCRFSLSERLHGALKPLRLMSVAGFDRNIQGSKRNGYTTAYLRTPNAHRPFSTTLECQNVFGGSEFHFQGRAQTKATMLTSLR